MAKTKYGDRIATGAKTADGNSNPFDCSQADELRVYLNITAVSGTTPTMVLHVQDTPDGNNWFTVASFASKNAAGLDVLNITTPFSDSCRLMWDLGGTSPSFTFTADVLRLESR